MSDDSRVPAPPVIDYDAAVNKLAARRRWTQAALTRFMKDKDAASFDDVASHVHGDNDKTKRPVPKKAERTSESLAELGCPVSFRLAGGMMRKEIIPE